MVACTTDPDGAAVDPGAAERAEPGRPACDGCCKALQGEREGCAAGEPGVDSQVCVRLVIQVVFCFRGMTTCDLRSRKR